MTTRNAGRALRFPSVTACLGVGISSLAILGIAVTMQPRASSASGAGVGSGSDSLEVSVSETSRNFSAPDGMTYFGSLETSEAEIRIYATDNGYRFSVIDAGGNVLGEHMTELETRAYVEDFRFEQLDAGSESMHDFPVSDILVADTWVVGG